MALLATPQHAEKELPQASSLKSFRLIAGRRLRFGVMGAFMRFANQEGFHESSD